MSNSEQEVRRTKSGTLVIKLARTAAIATLTILLLLLALAFWNVAAARWKGARNPAPGQLYLVYGKQMHLNCSGSGTPTVVIEAGAGANSLGWQGVQSQLFAADSRVHLRSSGPRLEQAAHRFA